MEMASTCIDRVLRDLQLLLNNFQNYHGRLSHSGWAKFEQSVVKEAIKDLKRLKIFLMCARKWSHCSGLFLESDNAVKQVNLPSFLSCIEDTLHKYEEDIHPLSLRSDTANVIINTVREVVPKFKKQIKSFKQLIIQVYFTLDSSRFLQSNSCVTDDELMEFIDLILQNLADLTRSSLHIHRDPQVSAEIQALEVKLTFLKRFVPFAKLQGTVDIPPLLLAHFGVVALNAARLYFGHDADERHTPEFRSMICEQQQKMKPVDFQVYGIYKEVLRATRSSKSLHSSMMDKQILNNFNDSLISCLSELLCCSSSFMDSMKDEMQILYAGLKFLRRILRQHQEKMNEQNERIGALLSEAGIIICSPSLNRVKEGKVSFLESTEGLDCYDMLAKSNIHIKHFKDQISGLSCKPSSRIPSRGKKPIDHEVIVGLNDEAEKVIERLISGPEQVKIVPIVGMAGLGKTTLAKKVYNDRSITYNFHIRLWCTVSQVFNMKNLLMQILCSDGKHLRMNEELQKLNEHELLQQLYQKLKGSRYLVVFDDIWDIKAWNELKYSFPDDENRSRILFTSRLSNVASQVWYGGEPHNLRPLSEEESLELLQEKVFGKENCPQALSGFVKEIAKKCRGLPLAVVVIAGVLATIEHDTWVWKEFAESLTSSMMSCTDQCKKSLKLSYDHLPYHLKACLLYFATFREDEKIGAKKLMRLWIAEGFVEKTEGKRIEDIAEEYLMDLIGRNLVMVSKSRSLGGVKTCYIHDLIFEFCKTEARKKDFLWALRGYVSIFNEPPNLSRLSICSNGEDSIESRLFFLRLGSLLFYDQIPRYNSVLHYNHFLYRIFKNIKVLNLQHTGLRLSEFPTEFESLLRLRYLALTAWGMTIIPPSIAKLSNLETFCLNSSETVSLPDNIWNMKKLRHLHVRNGCVIFDLSSNDNIVENLSILPSLETLSNLLLSFDQEGENILRRIPNIRQLRICNWWRRKSGYYNMSQLECLESLTLDLKCFSVPRDRAQLFPTNLKKLCLSNLRLPCSKMSLIEQLPKLEVIKLGCHSLGGKKWELMEGGFPKLRVLTLHAVGLVEWIEADPDSDDYFPCLQQLILQTLPDLEMVPSCLGRISTLDTIKMDGCRNDVKSLVQEIEEAQKNYGNECLKIIYERY